MKQKDKAYLFEGIYALWEGGDEIAADDFAQIEDFETRAACIYACIYALHAMSEAENIDEFANSFMGCIASLGEQEREDFAKFAAFYHGESEESQDLYDAWLELFGVDLSNE